MKNRLVLITQGISRVVMPILTQRDVEVVGIVESAPRDYSRRPTRAMTLRTVLARALAMIRPAPSLESVSKQHNLPYFLLHKANGKEFANWLKEIRVDLVVIYSMSQLLPQEILDIPSIGVLNLHPSLLPAYRGANPWFWMYYDAVSQGGVTLQYIDAGEDTGDIVYQRTYAIPLGMKSPAMQDLAIGKHGVDLILETLKQVGQGNALPRSVQPAQSPTPRARNIKPGEYRMLIDWDQWPIDRIWHLMRGTELWLDCINQPTGIYSGQRWVVDDFEKTNCTVQTAAIGQVKKDEKGCYVQCRDGIIRVHAEIGLYPVMRTIAKRLLK